MASPLRLFEKDNPGVDCTVGDDLLFRFILSQLTCVHSARKIGFSLQSTSHQFSTEKILAALEKPEALGLTKGCRYGNFQTAVTTSCIGLIATKNRGWNYIE